MPDNKFPWQKEIDVVEVIEKQIADPAYYETTVQKYCEIRALAMMAAQELKEARQQLHWIPVSERLPERPGEVLVSIAKYTVIAFFRGDGKFETAGGVVFKAGDMLTHWMPKPEPAKED